MREDQPGPVLLLHGKIIPRRRIAPRGIIYEKRVFLVRVTNRIVNVNGVRGFHHETVTDAVVGLEDHQRASFLLGQRYGATAKAVLYLLAGLKYGKNISDRQTVVGTAVQNNDHVLTNLGDATDNRHDAAINLAARRAREEVQRNIDRRGKQAVTRYR